MVVATNQGLVSSLYLTLKLNSNRLLRNTPVSFTPLVLSLRPPMMTPKLLLCLLIIAHFSFITCKDVYINSTALSSSCIATRSCSFLDPSLWNDNAPPATNDMVYIIDAPDNTFLVLNSSYLYYHHICIHLLLWLFYLFCLIKCSLSLSQLMMTGTVTLLVESGQLTASNVSLSNSTISLTGNIPSSLSFLSFSLFLFLFFPVWVIKRD